MLGGGGDLGDRPWRHQLLGWLLQTTLYKSYLWRCLQICLLIIKFAPHLKVRRRSRTYWLPRNRGNSPCIKGGNFILQIKTEPVTLFQFIYLSVWNTRVSINKVRTLLILKLYSFLRIRVTSMYYQTKKNTDFSTTLHNRRTPWSSRYLCEEDDLEDVWFPPVNRDFRPKACQISSLALGSGSARPLPLV